MILFIFYLILIIYWWIYHAVLARLSQKRKAELSALFRGTGGASQISQEDFGAASSSGKLGLYAILFVLMLAYHSIFFPVDEKNEDEVVENASGIDEVSQSQNEVLIESQQAVVMEKGME